MCASRRIRHAYLIRSAADPQFIPPPRPGIIDLDVPHTVPHRAVMLLKIRADPADGRAERLRNGLKNRRMQRKEQQSEQGQRKCVKRPLRPSTDLIERFLRQPPCAVRDRRACPHEIPARQIRGPIGTWARPRRRLCPRALPEHRLLHYGRGRRRQIRNQAADGIQRRPPVDASHRRVSHYDGCRFLPRRQILNLTGFERLDDFGTNLEILRRLRHRQPQRLPEIDEEPRDQRPAFRRLHVLRRSVADLNRPLTLIPLNRNASLNAPTHTQTGDTRRPPMLRILLAKNPCLSKPDAHPPG